VQGIEKEGVCFSPDKKKRLQEKDGRMGKRARQMEDQ
jgi:hypothetical protein